MKWLVALAAIGGALAAWMAAVAAAVVILPWVLAGATLTSVLAACLTMLARVHTALLRGDLVRADTATKADLDRAVTSIVDRVAYQRLREEALSDLHRALPTRTDKEG